MDCDGLFREPFFTELSYPVFRILISCFPEIFLANLEMLIISPFYFQQLKSEVDTNQDTVEMIRCSAEQLLMFASQSSVLADSSSHSSSMRSKSSGLSSMSPYTEETSEVKERLYILCSRFRMLKKKVANSLELVEVNAKVRVVKSSHSSLRHEALESYWNY